MGQSDVDHRGHSPGILFHNDLATNIIDGQYGRLFGITMSVLYTFHVGKKLIRI
ncbi:MAG TPA: hypothetical protein PLM53_03850 [Spirochaetota bacterium]|nr:hypothetical protein [Spirochaetota bacterium]HPC40216.1 hypothetical protein [Spirochaetota bacterium]HQH96211.1 hypothetical protein [Spirochaetota bacterium]